MAEMLKQIGSKFCLFDTKKKGHAIGLLKEKKFQLLTGPNLCIFPEFGHQAWAQLHTRIRMKE